MLKFIKRLFRSRWRVCRTGFPYTYGYGTYKKTIRGKILLDSGLTKEEAKAACKELNEEES